MVVSAAQVFDISKAKSTNAYTLLAEFWENGRIQDIERTCLWDVPLIFETNTFYPSGLSISLPSSTNTESITKAKMSNIEGKVGNIVRKPKGEIIVRIIMVEVLGMTSLYDTKNSLRLDGISITLEEVSGSIRPRLSIEEPYPPQRFPRNILPGTWYIQS